MQDYNKPAHRSKRNGERNYKKITRNCKKKKTSNKVHHTDLELRILIPCMKGNVGSLPEVNIQNTEQKKNSHMKFKHYSSNILLSFLIPQCQIRTRKGEKTQCVAWNHFTTRVTSMTSWNIYQGLVIYVSLHTYIKHLKLTHKKRYRSSNTQS